MLSEVKISFKIINIMISTQKQFGWRHNNGYKVKKKMVSLIFCIKLSYSWVLGYKRVPFGHL